MHLPFHQLKWVDRKEFLLDFASVKEAAATFSVNQAQQAKIVYKYSKFVREGKWFFLDRSFIYKDGSFQDEKLCYFWTSLPDPLPSVQRSGATGSKAVFKVVNTAAVAVLEGQMWENSLVRSNSHVPTPLGHLLLSLKDTSTVFSIWKIPRKLFWL